MCAKYSIIIEKSKGNIHMKKIIKILVIAMTLNMTAFASWENGKKTTVEVNLHIGVIENFNVTHTRAVLYNSSLEPIGYFNTKIDGINAVKPLVFEVEEYSVGEEFYFSCLNDIDCIEYNSEYYGINSKILLKTAEDALSEDGEPIWGNVFDMNLYPNEQKRVSFRRNSEVYEPTHPIKLVDGVAMISLVDVMNMFGLWEDGDTYFDDVSGRLTIYDAEKPIEMTLDSWEASVGGDIILPIPPMRINTLMYLPLRTVCEALGAEVKASSVNDVLSINLVTEKGEFPEKDAVINELNVSSKTDYFIWIDKSDFAVTVFKGSKNNWTAINSYPCSIGAPSSPTITGQFEYHSKENRWSYKNYYCGPIMRFYKGYAIHSTLVRYDGTDYDGRLGQKISHGCVRMRPADIQYMWDTIPLSTTVYITE